MIDSTMREVTAGRAMPDAGQRSTARRRIVVDCLRYHASLQPAERALREAAAAALEACDPVIDRYNHGEAMEAVLSGDAPPDPNEIAVVRASFSAVAASSIRNLRAGRCPEGMAPASTTYEAQQ